VTPPTHSVAHLVTRRPHPSQVALLVFAPNQRVTVYSSSPIEGLLQRFSEYKDTPEMHTNDDYFRERAHRESLEADGGRTQRARAASDGGAPALLAGDSAPTLAASVVPFATATAGVPAVAMQTAHAVFPQMAQATVLSAGAIQPAQAQQQFAVANVTALEQASASPQVAQATVAQITPAQVQPIAQAFNGQAIPLMAQPISQPVEVASVAAATSSATFATSSGDEPANKKARLDADDADDSATSSLPVAEAVQAPAEPHV